MPKMKQREKIKKFYKENRKISVTWYLILRLIVVITMVMRFIEGDYSSAFLCLLTLILFMIPFWVDDKFKIEIPDVMQIVMLLFIFAAEILGEINNFYMRIPNWDTILHIINGFLSAAIGFSLIDILNNSDKLHISLTPAFVSLVAICFSMTIGTVWEFAEYGIDKILNNDMQKDKVVQMISTVKLNPDGENKTIVIDNIEKTVIYSVEDGKTIETVIEGGYLDIGLNDTMKDLMVDFLGAIIFSIIGYFYIHNRDKYKFVENFIPKKKTE